MTDGDFKDAIKDRLSSPIGGTFLLSFLLTNWEFFISAFSSEETSKKINLMKFYLYENIVLEVIIATAITLIYLFLMPFLELQYFKKFKLSRDTELLSFKKHEDESAKYKGQEIRSAIGTIVSKERRIRENIDKLISIQNSLQRLSRNTNVHVTRALENSVFDISAESIRVEELKNQSEETIRAIEVLKNQAERIRYEVL